MHAHMYDVMEKRTDYKSDFFLYTFCVLFAICFNGTDD